MSKLRAIAIYLPQFHPIPENDEWWGRGFTEWTNVSKAIPRFDGHYQPHLPSELGFYDLRLNETREEQAELAKQFGIHGFCYYHYWFNGRLVLETPLQEVLKSKKPDFPFCLCWANENWTKRWDGRDQEILLAQNYNYEDDLNHIRYLSNVFRDERYIRVDGKPVFVVYRTELFPDIKRTAETWREEAIKLGIGELYLVRMESFEAGIDPKHIGFDAAIDFQPDWKNLPLQFYGGFKDKVLNKLRIKRSPFLEDVVIDYKTFSECMMKRRKPTYKLYPGIVPMWDNSARRRKRAHIFNDSRPEYYESWLRHIKNEFKPFSSEENFIFINAWNEWAEGNHLEPCQKWGKAYLEVTSKVLKDA